MFDCSTAPVERRIAGFHEVLPVSRLTKFGRCMAEFSLQQALLAVSDLHVSFPANREYISNLPASPHDWLLFAGDVGEKAADIEWTLRTLSARRSVFRLPGRTRAESG
jgi:hypothetical protein